VQADRTPEKCVLFPLFENLFLGALLDFLSTTCTERGKKSFSILTTFALPFFLASPLNRLDNSFKHADAHGCLGRA
jgi:hypothetical protein